MNITRNLLHPLLAAALLASACAGDSLAPSEVKSGTTPPPPPPAVSGEPTQGQASGCEDCNGFWEHFFRENGYGPTYFDFDSAELRPDAVQIADLTARWIDQYHPDGVFVIEGHTDNRGPNNHKLELGCRRATAFREALIERGIAEERLGTISYGEERPAVLGDNEDAWAQNRRGHFARP